MFEDMGWEFRKGAPDDATAIKELVRAVYAKYVPRMGRESKPMTADYTVALRDHQVWVARDQESLVAVLEIITEDGAFVLENIAVAEAMQGRGVGARLLGFTESEARRQGYAEVLLYTNEMMAENIALYKSRGYVETHREPVEGTDAVHMRKKVAPPT